LRWQGRACSLKVESELEGICWRRLDGDCFGFRSNGCGDWAGMIWVNVPDLG